VEVHFLDYGNKERVSCKDTRPLPVGVTDLPFQAFRCDLDVSALGGSWSEEGIARFNELAFDKKLLLDVCSLSPSSSSSSSESEGSHSSSPEEP
jgi:hypothetical protein